MLKVSAIGVFLILTNIETNNNNKVKGNCNLQQNLRITRSEENMGEWWATVNVKEEEKKKAWLFLFLHNMMVSDLNREDWFPTIFNYLESIPRYY